VHKSSVRLAAVCAGGVVREVTLPFDHARVERELRPWPDARVCHKTDKRDARRLAALHDLWP
jgi:hypothetical protein